MAKCLIFVLVALVAFQGALAKPKKAIEKSQIQTLANEAEQAVKNITSTIHDNLPDSETVVKTLKDNTQRFASTMQGVVDDLNKGVKDHQGDIEGVLKQVKETLTQTAEKLRTAIGPEATAKAQEIKTNLDQGMEKAIKEAEKLAKAAEPEATKVKEDLTNAAKILLDKILEVGKDVKEQLDKSLTEKHGKKQ